VPVLPLVDVEDVEDVVDDVLEPVVPVVDVLVDDVVLEPVNDVDDVVDELLDALPDVAPWLPLVLPAAVAPEPDDDALDSVVVFRPQPMQAQQDKTMVMAARFMPPF